MYTHVDMAGFEDRVRSLTQALEKLEQSAKKTDSHEQALVTSGRVSGVHLALSHLREFLVVEKER